MRRAIVPALIVVATLGLADGASACAVCQGGTSDNRLEFILTTALLTFLPLAAIGGVVWHLRRRYLALADQPRSDSPEIRPARSDAS